MRFNERETLTVKNGRLNIGGCDAVELAREFSTPLYVFDEDYIRKMAAVYRDTLSSEYGGRGLVKYASKAFCCKEMLRIVASEGLGLDVVSGGELYTAMCVDFPADKIYFHGNNKSQGEVDLAMEYGVKTIVVDSLDEIAFIDKSAGLRGRVQEVMLRVNPGVEAHTHHFIQTARVDSKFGLAIEKGYAESAIAAILSCKNLKLAGIHCHIGSQIFDKDAFRVAAEKMVDFMAAMQKKFSVEMAELNMGGGYGIWYSEGDRPMKIADYAEFLRVIIETVKSRCALRKIAQPMLSIEPGRSIVGEAGVTLYTAGNTKDIAGIRKFVSIDGGMFENPRYALYQAKYTAINASKADKRELEKVTLTGKCCESGDMIIDEAHIARAERGDVIAVFSTGAYNYSMASNYNRNPVPPVVAVRGGKARYMVRPQTYEDIVRNDV